MTTVPALPVVVPLAAVALAAMVLVLRRRRALTPLRAVVAAVACVYGAGVVAHTVFPINLGHRAAPAQSWTVYLNLVPLVNTELVDAVSNVVVFLPLGVLVPLLLRARSATRVVLVGFLLSLAMELTQLLNALTGHGGHVADVNDLLANTLGAALGYGGLRVALEVPALARVADAATWPNPRS